jgi:hypothetical protein
VEIALIDGNTEPGTRHSPAMSQGMILLLALANRSDAENTGSLSYLHPTATLGGWSLVPLGRSTMSVRDMQKRHRIASETLARRAGAHSGES